MEVPIFASAGMLIHVSQPLIDLARRAWSEVAEVECGFVPGELSLVLRDESRIAPPGWVGVVALGDACLAMSPSDAGLQVVESAARQVSVAELPHVSWTDHGATEVLGPAALYFGGVGDDLPAAATSTDPSDERVARLIRRVPPGDANEASVSEISSPAFVILDGDEVLAVAGYRSWPGGLAHVSVLTAPDQRRKGLGHLVATAAIRHASQLGLLRQWRARPQPSQRLAESLGLARLGAQVSMRVA